MSKRTFSFIATSAFLLAMATTSQADDWKISFGAQVVQFRGTGVLVSSITGIGAGPSAPGGATGTLSKKLKGGNNFYRVRIECTTDEFGAGQRVALVSPWAATDNTLRGTGVSCPVQAPYADINATLVQGASLKYFFDCQNNQGDFSGCTGVGDWF